VRKKCRKGAKRILVLLYLWQAAYQCCLEQGQDVDLNLFQDNQGLSRHSFKPAIKYILKKLEVFNFGQMKVLITLSSLFYGLEYS
jgi:hypothetical protein